MPSFLDAGMAIVDEMKRRERVTEELGKIALEMRHQVRLGQECANREMVQGLQVGDYVSLAKEVKAVVVRTGSIYVLLNVAGRDFELKKKCLIGRIEYAHE